MKLILQFVVLVFLSSVCFVSCTETKKSNRTDTKSSGHIAFAADESFSPVIDEEVQVFEASRPEAHLTAIYTNELDAINRLMNDSDSIWLVFAARDFKEKERDYLKKTKRIPISFPIAYDGLALIVNNSNPDSMISVKDVRRIFSGEATRWSDVFPSSKLGQIEVVFDNPKSSTVHWVADSLLGGKPINSPNIQAVKTSAEVIKCVEETPNAIGVVGSNWLNDKRDTTNITYKTNVTVMSVSNADKPEFSSSYQPYQAYIQMGLYPLYRTVWALLNDPRHGLPWGFAHFVVSPIGQKIILKSALLPYRGDIQIIDMNIHDEDE
ncbi:MAG: substrate-binding domain-containing protein [Bacteroidaceae bacterium]|nr:substrate-binding domain-containing protein [Bacteroidaceae bacterium]